MAAPSWKLYYWPGIGGRAEFLRLLFEDSKTKYIEINDPEKIKELCACFGAGNAEGWPSFAPPILEKPGGVKLAQTPAVCKFLGSQLGYSPQPSNPVNEAKADQVNLTIHDYFNEFARVASAAKNDPDSGGQALDGFKDRFEAFMSYFEKCLKANGGGSGLYLVGQKPTYADFSLLLALRATEDVIGDAVTASKFELLKGFKKRMESRPNLVAYWKSDRVKPMTFGSTMEEVRSFDRQFSSVGLATGSAVPGGRPIATFQTTKLPAKLAIKFSHLRKRRPTEE